MPLSLNLEEYSYDLPDDKIAIHPLAHRADAKILVFKNGKITDSNAAALADIFPKKSIIVLNETKVINARLFFQKKSGAVIEIFCLKPHHTHADISHALNATKHSQWLCIIGNRKKWKDKSELLNHVHQGEEGFRVQWIADIEEQSIIQFEWDDEQQTFGQLLEKYGNIPLPPYMHRAVAREDAERYQTVFAQDEGSVAAPTASLHITEAVLEELLAQGQLIEKITLHTGAGTFLPIKDNDVYKHKMHDEYINVSKGFIERWIEYIKKNDDYELVAIGTTAIRTLETIYWLGVKLKYQLSIDWSDKALTQWEVYELPQSVPLKTALECVLSFCQEQDLHHIITRTQLLILPTYSFRTCTVLMTNFHQPQSTLLLLVAAFVGDDYKEIYQYALDNDYRFLSYGDGSVLFSNNKILLK